MRLNNIKLENGNLYLNLDFAEEIRKETINGFEWVYVRMASGRDHYFKDEDAEALLETMLMLSS